MPGGTVTNAVNFTNTAGLTIPLGFAFTGGAVATAGPKSFAGVISANNAALNFGVTAVTLTGPTTFNAGSGMVTLGATTGAFNLIIQGSGGATIASANIGVGTLDLSGATGGTITVTGNLTATGLNTAGAAYNVALNGGGTITNAVSFLNTGSLSVGASGFAFTGGASDTAGAKSFAGGTISANNAVLNFGLTAVTLTGSTTFNGGSGLVTLGATTGAFNLILVGSGGALIASANLAVGGTLNLTGVLAGATVTVTGGLTAQAITTAAVGYNVSIGGGGTVTNAVSFLNTGNVTLGGGTYTGGVSSTAGGTNTLTGVLATGGGAGQNIALDDLTVGVGGVTLNAGGGGTIGVTGVTTGGGNDLAIVNSGGTTFGSNVNGVGVLTLSATTGTITFSGSLTASTLNTAGAAYNVALNGGGTITNAVSFLNTGSLSVGASGFAFTGGASDTAGAKSFAGGTISANNAVLNFGLTAVTLTGSTTFNGGSGLVTLGATTGAFNLILVGAEGR